MGALSTKPNQKQRIALVNLRRLQSIQLEHDAMHANGAMCGKNAWHKIMIGFDFTSSWLRKVTHFYLFCFFFIINDSA